MPVIPSPKKLQWFAAGTAAFAVLVALLSIVGWMLSVPALRSVRAGLPSMKPITAIGFVLISASLLLQLDFLWPRARLAWRQVIACLLCACVVVLMGSLLVQYAMQRDWGWSLAISRLMVNDSDLSEGVRTEVWAPVMGASPATALAEMLLALSVALLNLRIRKPLKVSELVALPAIILGSTGLIAHAFDSQALLHFHPYSSMAVHTAALLMLLGIGVILSRSDSGAMGMALQDNAGGRVVRRLLPAMIATPVVLGAWAMALQRLGVFGTTVEIVLLSILNSTVLCAAVILVAYPLARADMEQRRGQSRQRMMMAELDHRVKNTLAAILSLADLTMMTSSSMDSFSKTFSGRLRAMARTHEALASQRWEGVNMEELVRLTVAPMANKRLSIGGEQVILPARASSPVCMALHELATNAAKYGAINVPTGTIDIRWDVDQEGMLNIHWRESGITGLKAPTRVGFGTQLIHGAIGHELGGRVSMKYEDPGFACTMSLPIRALNEAQRLSAAGHGLLKEAA
jgi:two-component sensor histidine kinase